MRKSLIFYAVGHQTQVLDKLIFQTDDGAREGDQDSSSGHVGTTFHVIPAIVVEILQIQQRC